MKDFSDDIYFSKGIKDSRFLVQFVFLLTKRIFNFPRSSIISLSRKTSETFLFGSDMQQVKFPTKINLNKGVCVCLKASDNNHAWIWVAKIVRTKETQRGDHDILHHIFFQCIWFPLKAAWNKNMKGPKNNSILKEIDPEYLLEGLTLKLKLQYFGHLMWRTDWLEKTLMLGKIESRRRRMTEDEMAGWHHWLDAHEFE